MKLIQKDPLMFLHTQFTKSNTNYYFLKGIFPLLITVFILIVCFCGTQSLPYDCLPNGFEL